MNRDLSAQHRDQICDDRHPDVVRVVREHLARSLPQRRPRTRVPLMFGLAVALVLVVANLVEMRLVAAGLALMAAAVIAMVVAEERGRPVDLGQLIDEQFDRVTDLPYASAAPTVLADQDACQTLTGNIAVLSIELRVPGPPGGLDQSTTEMIAAVAAHRLKARKWIGQSTALYGPIIFHSPPHGFIVVLRDVIDRRTTGWLAGRLTEALGAEIRCGERLVRPQPVIGVAVGSVGGAPTMLLRHADDARVSAILHSRGPVVIHGDGPRVAVDQPVPVHTARGARLMGIEVGGLTRDRDVRLEVEHGLEDFERSLRTARAAGEEVADWRCFVRMSAPAMCRTEAASFILSIIERVDVPLGQVCLIMPAAVGRPGLAAAWNTITTLRRQGVRVYLEHGSGPVRTWAPRPDRGLDGLILDASLMAQTRTAHGYERVAHLTRQARKSGAEVVARVSSPDQREIVAQLGIDVVIGTADAPGAGERLAQPDVVGHSTS